MSIPAPDCETANAAPGRLDLAVYVHWPFCRAKCPYCDFNSHVREQVDQDRWRSALIAELDHFAGRTAGRRVTSVFFGGGTPSLMPPATVAAIIERIAGHWTTCADLEVTLEANPTSVEADSFAGFAAAGVNRASLGVQALDDAALAFLGRQHSAREALAAVGLARRFFRRVSFDLIYARPDQDLASWRDELTRALAERPDHISLYQLTIEPGTRFEGRHRRGELQLPDEDTGSALFDATRAQLAEAGLPAYEISNHAAPGEACRHNLTYWRYGDYLGIGPGAHGRLTTAGDRRATRQHRAPEVWLAQVEAQGHASRRDTSLDWSAQRDEMTMMGLRLTDGLTAEDFHRVLGRDCDEVYDRATLNLLRDGGFLIAETGGLRATEAGLRRLDAVLARLLGA